MSAIDDAIKFYYDCGKYSEANKARVEVDRLRDTVEKFRIALHDVLKVSDENITDSQVVRKTYRIANDALSVARSAGEGN